MKVATAAASIRADNALVITLNQNGSVSDTALAEDPGSKLDSNRFCPSNVTTFVVPRSTPLPGVPFVSDDYAYTPRFGCVDPNP